MSEITLNGAASELDTPETLSALMARLGYHGRVAVAVNGTVVPKSQHDVTTVNPGDEVEVVAPMKGG